MDWWMLLKAFVVGGLICVVGQLLIDLTKLTPARILVLFVTLGVVLTAVGLYEPLVKFAGGGATVPTDRFRVFPGQRGPGSREGKRLDRVSPGASPERPEALRAAISIGFVCALLAKSKDKS